MKKILLVMRKGCVVHGENIAQIRRLGVDIVALTARDDIEDRSRFHAVERVAGTDSNEEAIRAIEVAREYEVSCAVTFQETDIVLCARINEALGVLAFPAWAAEVCRDKSMQRDLLVKAAVPSVGYAGVKNLEGAMAAANSLGYPVILKPTRAAASMNVSLIHDESSLTHQVQSILQLVKSNKGFYFSPENAESNTMIVEEYLPGREVTLDAVVVDGKFFLGGIHNKMDMGGPYFEEDLYSLPFKEPHREDELCAIAQKICAALDLKNSLFNVELRADASGEFRVIEFSCRPSGGRCYRNIYDVYGVDMVSAHLASLMPQSFEVESFLTRRRPARATCIKLMYCNGKIVRNHAGAAAARQGFVDYYPLAKIGAEVRSAPYGFDIAGVLSVGIDVQDPPDPATAEKLALELAREVDLITE